MDLERAIWHDMCARFSSFQKYWPVDARRTSLFGESKDALQYISANDIAMVDLKMATISGRWIHVTIPARRFTQKHFEEGVGYDGSSGAGFGKVESGDVAAIPVPTTAFLDPFGKNRLSASSATGGPPPVEVGERSQLRLRAYIIVSPTSKGHGPPPGAVHCHGFSGTYYRELL